jgi:hypothetical protein
LEATQTAIWLKSPGLKFPSTFEISIVFKVCIIIKVIIGSVQVVIRYLSNQIWHYELDLFWWGVFSAIAETLSTTSGSVMGMGIKTTKDEIK